MPPRQGTLQGRSWCLREFRQVNIGRIRLAALFSVFLSLSGAALGQGLTGDGYSLFDREKAKQLFEEVEVSSEPDRPLDETFEREEPFRLSEDKWRQATKAVDDGTYEEHTSTAAEQVQVSSQTPEALPPSLTMPGYGTSLSVAGRKTIGFSFNSKRYMNSQSSTGRQQSTSYFDLQQQLQIQMQGKIGPRITVNVDYDDTKEEKQDISIVYQGESQDVVQNASFGDIDLSLPGTEFVQYNKQLFGIRVDLKYGGARATLIGSRTKGTTKTVQFVGNTLFQTKDIADTGYKRRQYYDLTFGNTTGRLPIVSGSEKVYLDDQSHSTANNIDVFDMTGDDMGVRTSTYTGRFKLLSAGVDYTIDYNKGLLTFTSARNSQDVVIVNFTNANGTTLSQNSPENPVGTDGTGRNKIIKTLNDLNINQSVASSEKGYNREVKTYYSIGQTQIVRDDGRGNFILQVQNLSGTEVGKSLNPAQYYSDTIEVDFEQGIFHLVKPFGSTSDPNTPDPDIYAASPVSKRNIHVEYHSRVKTFTLDSNIVVQSEGVMLNNQKLNRNVDYYIDYEAGFITFYNTDRITSSSVINITYDVSPYGGTGTSSLVGGRLSYDFGSHLTIGGTMLYETASKAKTAPSINDIAKSLMVAEGDAQFKNIRLLSRLKTSFGVEGAISKSNPNLNGFALIDNMEGVKQQDSVSVEATDWQIAANPLGSTAGPADPSALGWTSADVRTLDINPYAQASSNDTTRVLSVNYDLSVSSEVSIVYPYSDSGLDFSQKTQLELLVYADGSAGAPGPQINVHLGQITEDSDSNGGMTLYCKSGQILTGYPKTEDLNCDSQLSPDEDIGWLYSPSGKRSARYGAQNGKLDTQDLNHNGRLDAQDVTGGDFGYSNSSLFSDVTAGGTGKNTLDFTGWHVLQAPITVSSTETYKWAAIRQVRLSLKQAPGGKTRGVIRIARLSAVGNTWTVVSSSNSTTMTLSGINNVDNPSYQPIFSAGGEATVVYNDLYGSVSDQQDANGTTNISEQSLDIVYTSTGPDTAFAQRRFTKSMDLTSHEELRFLVNNPGSLAPGKSFVLRIGDDTNYQELSLPLTFTGWRLYVVGMQDTNGDGASDSWSNKTNYELHISSSGSPNFQQISLIRAGIRSTVAGPQKGEVWFDELHVAKPLTQTGKARMAKIDFDWSGWATFGAKYRYMDRYFQTPLTVSTKQDNEQLDTYVNFTRIAAFPVSANYSRQITTTPNALSSQSTNLVSLLSQGTVRKNSGAATGNLTLDRLPKLGLGYSFTKTKYELITRDDDSRTYSTTLSYQVPLNFFLAPKTLDANLSMTDSKVSYTSLTVLKTSGYYNSDESTLDWGARLSFTPWNGSTLNPSYNIRQVREKRTDYASSTMPLITRYDKSMTQTAAVNSNFRFTSWLNPTASYSITTVENNNLSLSTVTVGTSSQTFSPGAIKTVNRTANGGVNLTLSASEIFPRFSPLRTMTISSGYQLQDGDSWQNVESSLSTRGSLFVRTPLRSKSMWSSRTNLTLRDTYSSSQRWQPLESVRFAYRLSPLKTMAVSNNYTQTVQRSEVTGTRTKTVSTTVPDLLVSFSKMETLVFAEKWLSSFSVNLKYTRRVTETVNTTRDNENSYGTDLRFNIRRYFDSAISGNIKNTTSRSLTLGADTSRTEHKDATIQTTFDIKKLRLTPKIDFSNDRTIGADGVATLDQRKITPSILTRLDMNLPKGLKLPFFSNPFLLTNRVVWTTTLSYQMLRSPVTVADNSNLLDLSTSADYEISKNLRLTLNGAAQRLWHLYLPQEDYMSYSAGSTLTLQF